jgi:hypothetical protein
MIQTTQVTIFLTLWISAWCLSTHNTRVCFIFTQTKSTSFSVDQGIDATTVHARRRKQKLHFWQSPSEHEPPSEVLRLLLPSEESHFSLNVSLLEDDMPLLRPPSHVSLVLNFIQPLQIPNPHLLLDETGVHLGKLLRMLRIVSLTSVSVSRFQSFGTLPQPFPS